MAKGLTPEDYQARCEKLRANDLKYAEKLDSIQSTYLSNNPRIKNWHDFRTVQDMKSAVYTLHDKSDEVSVKVNGIEVTFVKPSKG